MLSYDSVREVVAKALLHGGAQVSATRFEWDVSGRCERPVTVNLFARKQKGRKFEYTPGETKIPLEMNMGTNCRRCNWCLRQRMKLWRTRAYNEGLISSRIWFGTLTLNQQARTNNLMLAHKLARSAGFDLDTADKGLQSKYRHKANVAELARWLKRVRKNASTRFRYLLVSEDHEDGTPHYHVLIFESFAYSQVTKRHLESAWRLGFTQFRLCEPKKAGYVTKYLSKSATARVRASTRLGSGPRAHRIAPPQGERGLPDPRPGTLRGDTSLCDEGSPVAFFAGGPDLPEESEDGV